MSGVQDAAMAEAPVDSVVDTEVGDSDGVVEAADVAETTEIVGPTDVVEATETAEAVEEGTPEEAAVVEEVIEAMEAAFDWNGELDSLKAAEWLSGLDERTRNTILRGIETKYRNFERGYTTASQKNADRRRTLDRREKDVRDQEIRVQKWMHGDIDPLAEKQAEIDNLKAQQEAATQALREEYANALRSAQTQNQSRDDATFTKLQSAQDQVVELSNQLNELQSARDKDLIAGFDEFIKAEAPDLADNIEAQLTLCGLIEMDMSPDQALLMLRARYPMPQKAEPEELPPSVDLMNLGTSAAVGTKTGEVRSIDEMLDSLRRDAQSNGIGG